MLNSSLLVEKNKNKINLFKFIVYAFIYKEYDLFKKKNYDISSRGEITSKKSSNRMLF